MSFFIDEPFINSVFDLIVCQIVLEHYVGLTIVLKFEKGGIFSTYLSKLDN